MEKFRLARLSKEERREFYQSKYDYYSSFNTRMVVVSVLAYLTFFFTDCGIFGRFAYETLLSRTIVIIPFLGYLFLTRRTKDYRIMVTCSYLMIHIIIWCTDWATYLLPDRQFAIAGMIIMNLIFVCAGFAAPFSYSMIAHIFLIVDIAVANIFIQYDELQMMYMFNIPCIVAVGAMHHMMQGVYLEQYLTKNKLENLIVHDQLTEVHNRNILKGLSDGNTGELIRFAGVDVSMLLIDIDFFKKVNDTYGHEAGDKVLIYLTRILKNIVRGTDYVIRWGGEEFLIIMPGCTEEQAFRVAEKIREKVELSDNGICKVTISVGVAPYKGGDYHIAIKNADDALYKAKGSGRNKVVLYEAT
ncbi:MAG: GGDEF domain-containing protein [Lachnospiraceae bacterium]|nr:GGDEF domain-containing protein [Lachnospiraceae bacterium]